MQYRRYRQSKKFIRKQKRKERVKADIKAWRSLDHYADAMESTMEYLRKEIIRSANEIFFPEPVQIVTFKGSLQIN